MNAKLLLASLLLLGSGCTSPSSTRLQKEVEALEAQTRVNEEEVRRLEEQYRGQEALKEILEALKQRTEKKQMSFSDLLTRSTSLGQMSLGVWAFVITLHVALCGFLIRVRKSGTPMEGVFWWCYMTPVALVFYIHLSLHMKLATISEKMARHPEAYDIVVPSNSFGAMEIGYETVGPLWVYIPLALIAMGLCYVKPASREPSKRTTTTSRKTPGP